ncbi:hypothetical protein HY990_05180 [Candidatus Micrarchaeota archaeon]|nr:hypothetical protein [Candidatus Micrarchaeota archaeon]
MDKDKKKEFDVAVSWKIYVENPEKIDAVKKQIENIPNMKINKIWEEEVGFGIKALKIIMLLPDSDGGMDALQEKIASFEGVSQAEVEDISRV